MKKLLKICFVLCLAALMLVSCGKNKEKDESQNSDLSYFVNPAGNTCTVTGILDNAGSQIVIDSIDGYTVTAIQRRAFLGCESIKSVVVGDSVTLIEELAFANCINLERVKLPSGLKTIQDSVFYGCEALTTVEFSNELTEIGNAAFLGCSSLTEINIPNGVKRIGKLSFAECNSLKKVTIPDSVNEIDWYAFDGCTSLSGVYISDIAAWCKMDFATDTANPLYYAKKLYLKDKLVKDLTFSKNVNKNVNKIGDRAFINCKDISLFTINNSSVTSIGAYAFSGTGVKNVLLSNDIEFIGVGAFKDCSKLEQIKFDGTMAQWNNIYCGGDINAIISCLDGVLGNDTVYVASNGLEYVVNDDKVSCTITGIGTYKGSQVVIGEYIDGSRVTAIGTGAFEGCEKITDIVLPDSISDILAYAFAGCKSLKSINIPDGVEIIGDHSFQNCVSLKSVELPKGLTKILEYSFYNCSSLNGIEIPENVITIGSSAFEKCSSLEVVSISKNLTYIESGAFMSCENLELIKFDGARSHWESISRSNGCFKYSTQVILICAESGEYEIDEDGNIMSDVGPVIPPDVEEGYSVGLEMEFNSGANTYRVIGIGECTDKKLYIPNKYKGIEVTGIYMEAFSGNTQITEVNVPDGISEISMWAFRYCSNLQKIDMQYVTEIGTQAFEKCSKLESIMLGASLTRIRSSVFDGCTALKTIVFAGTREQWESIEKDMGCFSYPGNLTLICTDGEFEIDKNGDVTEKTEPTPPETSDYSEGIEYYLLKSENIYLVSGIGVCKDDYLKIPAKIDGIYVAEIETQAFYSNQSIKGVAFEEGMNFIGNNAFFNCSNISEVIFPTTLHTIDKLAFGYCSNLEYITIPGSCVLENSAFSSCTSLRSATIQNVTRIETGAFTSCYNMRSVSLGECLEMIGNTAFFGCDRLEEIYYEGTGEQWEAIAKGMYCFKASSTNNFEPILICKDGKYKIDENGNIVEKIEDIEYLEYSKGFTCDVNSDGESCTITGIGNCKDDVIVIGGYIDGYKVTHIADNAFANRGSFSKVVIDDGVLYIGESAFAVCIGLTEVVIGNGVNYIGEKAFSGCKSLESITIPDSVTEIGAYTFENCKQLTYVDLLGNIQSIPKYMFKGCESLKSITIPQGVTTVGTCAFADCNSLEYVYVPLSVTSLDDSSFLRCLKLQSIVYDGNVEDWYKIKIVSAFRYTEEFVIECADGKIIVGADFEFGVLDSGEVFVSSGYGDADYVTLQLPDEYEGKAVIGISDKAFARNKYINSVIVPDSITSIGNSVFANCSNLQSVQFEGTISAFGSNLFDGCSDLEKIYYNGTREEWHAIEKGDEWYPDNSFVVYCSDMNVLYDDMGNDITEVVYSNDIFEIDVINSNTNTIKITGITDTDVSEVIIYELYIDNDGLIYHVERIGNNAFANQTKINTVTIPSSVKLIGKNAFDGCVNLKTVVINTTLVIIEKNAFANCTLLESIVFNGTKSQWESIQKDINWIGGVYGFEVVCTNGTIHY